MSTERNLNYHHGNLRISLIDAALLRLENPNAEAPSLRELAKAVGVSIAAVYRHFPNKNALLAEVAVDGFVRLVEQWKALLPATVDVGAEARFRRLGEVYIEFALANPAHYRLMFLHVDLRDFRSLRTAAEQCFAYVLDAAAETVREAGAEARWVLPTANAAWSLVHGYVMLALSGRLTTRDGVPDLSPQQAAAFLQLPPAALT